jgi:ribosome-binding factor A
MPLSHRVERVAEQIREEVSQILATEVADPGIGLITVTRVKVSPDLSLARIYWTTMGDAAERKKTAKALGRAAAFVRHLLATRMSLRRSPEVTFLFDESVAAQDRVEQILLELKQEEAARVGEQIEGGGGIDGDGGIEQSDSAEGTENAEGNPDADQPKRV